MKKFLAGIPEMIRHQWQYHKEEVLLAFILIVGGVLRFANYSGWSLSNDELSALNRLQYDKFTDLINLGVKQNDFHPAGVQVLLYLWTSVFGYSPESVRLPFVITGIASVWLSYLISAKWFTKTTGLFVALSMSFLAYPILYSQLARPYSPGLLFSLASVWFWTKIVIDKNSRIPTLVLYILTTHLATITHHFSFLFVLTVGVHGLFLIGKTNWKPYLITGLVIFLLYLPHMGIFLYQFGIGGVGGADGWLSKPSPLWFFQYLSYAFNDSPVLIALFGFLLFVPFTFGIKAIKFNVFQKLSLSFFLLPFVIGFLYSVFRNPVLQYSILIFSFPFLLMFIFSFYQEKLNRFYLMMLLILGVVGTGDLFLIKKYYKEQHFAEFWGISRKIAGWNKELGTNNISRVAEVNAPYYIHYYLDRYEKEVDFFQYTNNGLQDLRFLKNHLEQSSKPYFIYARLKPAPLAVPELIQSVYPYILDYQNYSDLSEFYIFSKEPNSNNLTVRNSFLSVSNAFDSTDLWMGSPKNVDSLRFRSGNKSYKIMSTDEYGPGATLQTAKVFSAGKPKLIKATVWVWTDQLLTDTHLIISIESKTGKIIGYSYSNAELWVDAGKWQKLVCLLEMPSIYPHESLIKSYIWNKNHQEFLIDDYSVEIY